MNELLRLIRSDLHDFIGYSSARDEAVVGSIWLNANESPYDRTLDHRIKINRYPEKQYANLINRLAVINHLEPSQILLSRGSDEGIDLLMRLFCCAGKDSIITCPPSYGMYSVYARLQGARIIEIPLVKEKNFQLNLQALQEAITDTVKIIFICSPNNPTGNLINLADILSLCRLKKCIVVIDEAYIEYANAESISRYLNQYEHLVILRTFSKAYALAGARLGYLLAHPLIIKWLLKIIAPYPLPMLSTQLAVNQLSDDSLKTIHQQIASIKSERDRLYQTLKNMPLFTRIWDSETNYLLLEANDPERIMAHCFKQGIVLRSMFDKKNLEQCIRITVGLEKENTHLINALKEIG